MHHPKTVLLAFTSLAVSSTPLLAAPTAPTQTCYVNSYCSPEAPEQTRSYRLTISPIPTVCRRLDVETARNLAKAALSWHGMYEAPDGLQPEVEVTLSVDMWEQILPAKNSFLRFRPVAKTERVVERQELDEDGSAHRIRERMLVPANHGYGPAQERVEEIRQYQKRLSLAARAPHAEESSEDGCEWWRVEVATCDRAEDIAITLPVLLSVAMDRIGVSSDGREEVVLTGSEKSVQFVSAGW